MASSLIAVSTCSFDNPVAAAMLSTLDLSASSMLLFTPEASSAAFAMPVPMASSSGVPLSASVHAAEKMPRSTAIPKHNPCNSPRKRPHRNSFWSPRSRIYPPCSDSPRSLCSLRNCARRIYPGARRRAPCLQFVPFRFQPITGSRPSKNVVLGFGLSSPQVPQDGGEAAIRGLSEVGRKAQNPSAPSS